MEEYAQQYASQPALTMQQAQEIAGKAWDAARKHLVQELSNLAIGSAVTAPDRDTYLKSLNLKYTWKADFTLKSQLQ